jgi:hypothetical protein
MTQTLDLEKMRLAPMNELEIIEVDGGKTIDVLCGFVVGLVIVCILI